MVERAGGRAGQIDELLEVTVERIVPGGLGLAFGGGRTLFVALAAPGDRLLVRLDRVRGRTAFASIVEILEASPARVEPPYPAGARCGGCDFQHLSYEAQLAAKVEIVRDCLRRIGGMEPPPDLPITPSPRQWGYRARTEWRHNHERGLLGHVEQGSHRVCDIVEDPIVVPALRDVLADLRRRLAAGELPAAVTEFHAAAGARGVSLAPPLAGEEPAEIACTVGDERYAYAADCFFQANPGVLHVGYERQLVSFFLKELAHISFLPLVSLLVLTYPINFLHKDMKIFSEMSAPPKQVSSGLLRAAFTPPALIRSTKFDPVEMVARECMTASHLRKHSRIFFLWRLSIPGRFESFSHAQWSR